ncbi:DUF6266 family protein [Aequorivita sp. SDUM287046]|uniref:DUF6266 family protein n=1 Tax=Aequorivita aurantiaca TaxID=3053356 RepID=A0ABT8DPY5_9FLAO|nr:DUF6266 family protein [Aequorivita aurantiaca]MDN3725285.1 DUF6266 family protein [Aequorivita aurantiaca]
MGTIKKGILGGFRGKVGSVVVARWRGKYVMRSFPEIDENRIPTEKQRKVRERFGLVARFLNPMKPIVGKYFVQKQGDKSPFNLATSYHIKEAVLEVGEDFIMDYPKVLISKGDLSGLQSPTLTASIGNTLQLTYTDNTGQGFAKADDQLLVLLFVADLGEYQLFTPAGTRVETIVNLPLPQYWSGLEINAWATFVDAEGKRAATSTYLGAVTAL